jgi:hypothetical protein
MAAKNNYKPDEVKKFCEEKFNLLRAKVDILLMFHNLYSSAFPKPFIASAKQQAGIEELEKEFSKWLKK